MHLLTQDFQRRLSGRNKRNFAMTPKAKLQRRSRRFQNCPYFCSTTIFNPMSLLDSTRSLRRQLCIFTFTTYVDLQLPISRRKLDSARKTHLTLELSSEIFTGTRGLFDDVPQKFSAFQLNFKSVVLGRLPHGRQSLRLI